MPAIETIEREGFVAKIYYDADPQSPDDWDTLATFEHTLNYTFGEQISEPERGWDVYMRWLTLSGTAAAVIGVYIADYGSGGLRCYPSDNPNAVLYTNHERVTQLCGDGAEYHTREWIEQALRGECETWNQYLEQDVYGYVIEQRGEQVDSCWGFYGMECVKEEVNDILDGYAADRARAIEQGMHQWRYVMALAGGAR